MPLADRVRPKSFDEVAGQKHLLAPGAPFRRIMESGHLPSLVFYGPPGTGKTTVADIIAKNYGREFYRINATTASLSDIKDILALSHTVTAYDGIILYIDEIQYFNKKQQQSLLQYIENGAITLIASTTENPYFYIYSAVLSRSTVFEFKSVTAEDMLPAIDRGYKFLENESGTLIEVPQEVKEHIAYAAGGDVRKALNFVELSVLSVAPKDGKRVITPESVMSLTQKNTFRYDKKGDENYDVMSAFQKSMRGSDPNAALHYLARLLEAGDLPSATRRLMVCACEDVGLAYPMIIPIVKAAVDAALQVGLPEARIPLADAVVLVCTAPKSNSAYKGINAAMEDVQNGNYGRIPRTLQNKHFDGEDNPNKGQFYKYPHDYKNHYVSQQYLPDDIKSRKYYVFGDNKIEQAAKAYWDLVKGKT